MKLIYDLSAKGRRASVPPCPENGVERARALFSKSALRQTELSLPEVAEVDLVRHFSKLAKKSFGVDDGFYPLGSCTMKLNPKVNDAAASLPGFLHSHPLAPAQAVQGSLEVLYRAQQLIGELTGMHSVTLMPAAGAHGELTGMMMIRAYHRAHGQPQRTRIIVPDSAHGTNPASANMAGFDTVEVPSRPDGRLDVDAIAALMDERVAGLMLTNPSTLGLFENEILKVSQLVHDAGGLLYYDGANFNAIMERARPGDMGFDIVHLNVHKTLSTPHGMGGPGGAPVAVSKALSPFLPAPVVQYDGKSYTLGNEGHEKSIGRMRSYHGNFGVMVRALTYMLSLGGAGLREASGMAVLNANYLRVRLQDVYRVATQGLCMHEFVISCQDLVPMGVHATDIAKSLIDRGIHPPTMYFPLIIKEALMIEPTETESVETLDAFVEMMLELYETAKSNPEKLTGAPYTTPIGRPDEVQAARHPVVRA